MEDVDEAQWTSEWLKSSNPNIETRMFKGIDNCWPTDADLIRCLGVVLTGSTCTCVDDYPHTEPLFSFFKTVIRLQVPMLTICYSAQMLVRWLGGKENVTHLSAPHVGFIRIEIPSNDANDRCFPLLSDVMNRSLISVSAQSDAFILPDKLKQFPVQVASTIQETRFIHAASTTGWKYQAFELHSLPVWGVQFHPNWSADNAETVFHILKSVNLDVTIKREGTVDEDERCHMAGRFLSACHQHAMLKKD